MLSKLRDLWRRWRQRGVDQAVERAIYKGAGGVNPRDGGDVGSGGMSGGGGGDGGG